MSCRNSPRLRESVWVPSRREENLNPNGIIIEIDRDNEEITVYFYDKTYVVFDSYAFEGMYTSKFGGGWWLEDS